MILTLTVILWLAASYIEYKIVSTFPAVAHHFHGVKGMVISICISGILGLVMGSVAGVVGTTAAAIAAVIGLATNDFTFKLFSGIATLNSKRKHVQTKVATVKTQHPSLFKNVIDTCSVSIKFIGICFGVILYILGLPGMIARKLQRSTV